MDGVAALLSWRADNMAESLSLFIKASLDQRSDDDICAGAKLVLCIGQRTK